MSLSPNRSRIVYFGLSFITILSGLLSRSTLIMLPDFISTYAGDTFWALIVFFLICTIFPRWKTKNITIAALLFAFGIEFSQFYHAPWIEELRHIKIGGLILGFGFKLSDLVCYTVGVSLGFVIDSFLISKVKLSQL